MGHAIPVGSEQTGMAQVSLRQKLLTAALSNAQPPVIRADSRSRACSETAATARAARHAVDLKGPEPDDWRIPSAAIADSCRFLSRELRSVKTSTEELQPAASIPAAKNTRFWHPFSDMRAVAGNELILDRGHGVWVWDVSGKRYLDATAGLWYCFVGHGRSEIGEAASRQMAKLASYSSFGDMASAPTIELAERIAALSPIPDTAVFFTSGGSESIETAAKLARRYWSATGQPQKRYFVTRGRSYHGVAGFGASLAGIPANQEGFGPLLEEVIAVAPDDCSAVARLLEERSGEIAAFFGEPVQGAGGVYPPGEGYWKEIERLCRKHDVLLICDEVITGFGRLGSWFASTRFGISPDMITGAKGVTSGYLPLGVVLCGPRVQEPFWRGSAGLLRHGYTYSGHAAVCAAALANLAIMEEEKVVEHAAAMEGVLAAGLAPLRAHALVAEVRTIGMLAAVELTKEVRERVPGAVERVLQEARNGGLLTRNLLGQALQISPALIIQPAEIRALAEGFREALDRFSSKHL